MDKHLRVAELLTEFLENKFKIGNTRFGFEPIIGLIPVLGDIISLFISFYLLWIGRMLHLPEGEIERMRRNIIIDFAIGLVPFFGDIGDFMFRANSRNLKILKEHAGKIIEGEIVE